jgi:phasin family protein
MAKRATDFAQQNTERAMEMTAYGMDWVRELTERNLEQTKTAVDSLLTITRKAVDDIDHQACAVRERSLSLAEQTLANAFDFAHRLMQVKDPQQLAQLQSEFVSRQAHAVGEQAKELAQTMAQGTHDLANATLREATESTRRQSEAA